MFFYQFLIMFLFNSAMEDVRKMDSANKARTET